MKEIIEHFKERARQRGGRVVFPEGDEPRIVAAARQLLDEGVAQPILLCSQESLLAVCERAGLQHLGLTVVDPAQSDRLDAYARLYLEQRPKAGL